MALPKLEGIITIPSGSSVSVTETGGGGTASVSLTAGDYSLSELCTHLSDALTSNGTLSGTYSCSVSDDSDTSTGKVTIGATGITSFTLTWTSTIVRDALGFSDTLTPTATAFTATNASPWIWLPNVGRSDAAFGNSDEGRPNRTVAINQAPDGTIYSWASSALRYDNVLEFINLRGHKVSRELELVVNESLQTFFETVISKGITFRYYADRADDEEYVGYVAKQGSAERLDAQPLSKGWRGTYSAWTWRCDVLSVGRGSVSDEEEWTPLSLGSKLRCWLKGDAGITLSSGAVSAWADQSGNARHFTQGTAGDRPVVASAVKNGLDAVQFVTADFLSCSAFFTGSEQGEGFFVQRVTASIGAASGGHTFGSSSSDTLWPYSDNNVYDSFGVTSRPNVYTSGSTAVLAWHLASLRTTSTNLVVRFNGAETYNATATKGWASTFKIGSALTTFKFLGYVGEVLLTDALTDGERTLVEAYLTARWAL